MSDSRTPDVTDLLVDWRGGNHGAVQKLPPLAYGVTLNQNLLVASDTPF